MKLKLECDIDIHQLVEKNVHSEIDRILKAVSNGIKLWDTSGDIRDINNNIIGKYELK